MLIFQLKKSIEIKNNTHISYYVNCIIPEISNDKQMQFRLTKYNDMFSLPEIFLFLYELIPLTEKIQGINGSGVEMVAIAKIEVNDMDQLLNNYSPLEIKRGEAAGKQFSIYMRDIGMSNGITENHLYELTLYEK